VTNSASSPFFRTLGIIGVGLIGGSIGLSFKKAGLVHQVLGAGRSTSNLETALQLGQIDHIVDAQTLAKESDLIVICVPVAKTKEILQSIVKHLKPNAMVFDVGSTKMDVIAAAKEVLVDRVGQFIPCHPIAGGAQHGAIAAKDDLFYEKQMIVCPLLENRPLDVQSIVACWEKIGASVFQMGALEHDHIFAAVSHLPHLLSYALMLQIANAPDAEKKFVHAGAGFRDFTRIAGSSPEMWTDISLANRSAILQELDAYLSIIERMKKAIQEQDTPTLQKMLQIASDSRNQWQK
jgi:prephenate dehydrogenase